MLCCALTAFFLATAVPSDDPAYAALIQRQEAFRQVSYPGPPSMPQAFVVTHGPAFTVRDARLMDLPEGASGEARMLLVASDVADVREALLTGDWRGGMVLTVELMAGAQAFEGAAATLYDLNEKARPAADTRAGIGELHAFDSACAPAPSPTRVRSGYVALTPTSDADRVQVRLNLGWGPGETLKGELAATWMPRPAHVHGRHGPTCSPAFSALSKQDE